MSRTEARPAGGTSLDLLVVSSLAVVSIAHLWVPSLSGLRYLQVPLGVLLVLFLPGYALVSAVFPSAGAVTRAGSGSVAGGYDADVTAPAGPVISGPTRLVLATGLSAGATPLVGMALAATPLGVAPIRTTIALAVITVLFSALAFVRRRRVGFGQFDVSLRRGAARLRTTTGLGGNREAVLNLLLVAGLLVAVAGLGLAVGTSENGERYTEFYLLSEDQESGELVADAYPEEVVAGEATTLHVGIANHERRTVTYTVVVQLERVEGAADNPTIVERSRLDAVERTVRDGRTVEFPHAVEPTLRGESLRLTYLLYVGPPADNPSTETAHRSLHLWIDVVPRGS